jgi:DNA-directed RNA polymerase I, II, and III subunit RPABC3
MSTKPKTARGGPFYEDIFTIKGFEDPKFNNVARLNATNETSTIDVTVDIQSELYRLKTKEKFTLALAHTLNLDGRPDDGTWTPGNTAPSLLDKYDYGMYGKVYKVEAVSDQKTVVYVSHGGLLMKLQGDNKTLAGIEVDRRVYTLMKKVV